MIDALISIGLIALPVLAVGIAIVRWLKSRRARKAALVAVAKAADGFAADVKAGKYPWDK